MNKEDNFKEKFKLALTSTAKVISDDYTLDVDKKNKNLSSKNIDFIEKELKNKSSETEDLKEILKIFSDYNFNIFERPTNQTCLFFNKFLFTD